MHFSSPHYSHLMATGPAGTLKVWLLILNVGMSWVDPAASTTIWHHCYRAQIRAVLHRLGCWNAQIPFCSVWHRGMFIIPRKTQHLLPVTHKSFRNAPPQTHNPCRSRAATGEDAMRGSVCAVQHFPSLLLKSMSHIKQWSSQGCYIRKHKVVVLSVTCRGCFWREQTFSKSAFFFFFVKAPHLNTEVHNFKKFQESLKHHFWITLWCLSERGTFLFSWVAFLPSSRDVHVWYWTQRLPWCLLVVSLGCCEVKASFLVAQSPSFPSLPPRWGCLHRLLRSAPHQGPPFWAWLTEEATEEKQLRLPRDAPLIVPKDEKTSLSLYLLPQYHLAS